MMIWLTSNLKCKNPKAKSSGRKLIWEDLLFFRQRKSQSCNYLSLCYHATFLAPFYPFYRTRCYARQPCKFGLANHSFFPDCSDIIFHDTSLFCFLNSRSGNRPKNQYVRDLYQQGKSSAICCGLSALASSNLRR